MTLREKQSLHVRFVGLLIEFAYQNGYELTWGQTLRSKEEAARNAASGAGISNSLHNVGLAVDLNLFKDGRWLTDSESHRPLGDFWKSLHPECRWGGDFRDKHGRPKPDGNHYSIEFEGRK